MFSKWPSFRLISFLTEFEERPLALLVHSPTSSRLFWPNRIYTWRNVWPSRMSSSCTAASDCPVVTTCTKRYRKQRTNRCNKSKSISKPKTIRTIYRSSVRTIPRIRCYPKIPRTETKPVPIFKNVEFASQALQETRICQFCSSRRKNLPNSLFKKEKFASFVRQKNLICQF